MMLLKLLIRYTPGLSIYGDIIQVTGEEMLKRDFRKAIQITELSVISSIIVAVMALLVEF